MISRKIAIRRMAAAASCLLIVSQGRAVQAQAAIPAPTLVITILEGEGALNNIRQRTAREPIVEVDDENHKPVAGALVLFSLPTSGPGGVFADGTQSFSTVTDSAGRAVAQGLTPNHVSGSYSIHVHVTYNGASSEANIHQQNVSGESSTTEHVAHAVSLKTVLIVLAATAAAGAAAAIALGQGNNSTTITAGAPTVGPPTATARTGFRIQLHFGTR